MNSRTSKRIASLSFGKDSLCMLINLIDRKMVDEAVFYDTGMEFQAIYDIRDNLQGFLDNHNIRYTELKPDYDFLWKMFEKPVEGRKNGFHYGYSWCGGRCRWGTSDKIKALDKYAELTKSTVYIGIAADEQARLIKEHKPYKFYPLADWKITEAEALKQCYDFGFHWTEHNSSNGESVHLYDVLSRVSCYCCANKNLEELYNIYKFLPDYWRVLRIMQRRTSRPMKGEGKSVFDLEKRFAERLKKETMEANL